MSSELDSQSTQKISVKSACINCGEEFTGLELCPNDGTKLTPLLQHDMIGKIVGEKYEILEIIGGGGMGLIYKARHLLMKRLVAIKMMHPRFAASALTLKRFQQEAQAASALSHPNVLTVYDFGLANEGQPYLVMDYLEGTNLAEVLDKEQFLKPVRAVKIFSQVAAGLFHAHSKGVIHRDLKPGNIMLIAFDGEQDFVKIVDFGIAKLILPDETETGHLTQTGEVFGSPLYMSPEQCRGKELDARSDIYSLGCVMYRTLAGTCPFIADDAMQCMYMQVHEDPENISTNNSEAGVSPELERVIFKCLAKDPVDRFQTMQELKEALDDCKPGGRTVEAQMSKTFRLPASDESTNIMAKSASTADDIPVVESAPSTVLDMESSSGVSLPTLNTGPGTALTSHHDESIGAAAMRIPTPAAASGAAYSQSTSTPSTNASTVNFAGGSRSLPLSRAKASQTGLPPSAKWIAVGVAGVIAIGVVVMLATQKKEVSPKTAPSAVSTKIDESESADALNNKAQQLLDSNHYKEALDAAALALTKAKKTGDKADTIEATDLMAKAHFNVGNYIEASKEFQSVIKLSGNAKTPVIADALTGLGNISIAKQDIGNARKYLSKGLAIRESFNGPDHAAVVDSYSSLGNLCMLEGKSKEAIKYLDNAVSISSNTMGATNISTAKFLNQLGEAYSYSNNLKAAETNYRKALDIREKQLSATDPNLADSYVCLGTLEFRKHDSSQAETYFQKAMNIYEKSIGLNNLQAASVQFCLGVLYDQKRDWSKAAKFYKSALDERTAQLGANDPKTKQTHMRWLAAQAKANAR